MNNTKQRVKTTVRNLDRLADYIEEHVPQENLDMSEYRSDGTGGYVTFWSKDECGTVGCALGYAPFAIPEVDTLPFIRGALGMNWASYSHDLFPAFRAYTEFDEYLHDYYDLFDDDLSSDKAEVVSRLRDKAHQIWDRWEIKMNNKDKVKITLRNLHKLADYIEQHVAQENLNMKNYRSDDSGQDFTFWSKDECGTVGCALGYAPFAIPEVDTLPFIRGALGMNWASYSHDLFPAFRAYTEFDEDQHDSDDVFGGDLSSDKDEIVSRLRDKAHQIWDRWEEYYE